MLCLNFLSSSKPAPSIDIYNHALYFQFSHTVQQIVNSLADNKRKEKLGGKKRGEVSDDTLDHLVSVLESWKQDEEGLQVMSISFNHSYCLLDLSSSIETTR